MRNNNNSINNKKNKNNININCRPVLEALDVLHFNMISNNNNNNMNNSINNNMKKNEMNHNCRPVLEALDVLLLLSSALASCLPVLQKPDLTFPGGQQQL